MEDCSDMSESNPFTIVGGTPEKRPLGRPLDATNRSLPAPEQVHELIDSSAVFLFMKGTPEQPLCGFSANAVAMLEAIGAPYATFDVLSDENIRQAAKQIAGWPTFPQLWVKSELVGGNDIMAEMHSSGELEPLVKEARS